MSTTSAPGVHRFDTNRPAALQAADPVIRDPRPFCLTRAESPADVEYAKSLCIDCPVRRACLTGAIDRQEPWGVWGGELFVQGIVVPRKRPRGRPRKNEVAA